MAIMAPGALMGLMEEWQHSMVSVEIPGYDTESWEHLLNQSQPQQQPPPQGGGFAAPMLEAVEGIITRGGSVDASSRLLPQLVVDSGSNEGTTAGSTSPARSRHGDADPVTSSRKRKKDRPSAPEQGERGKRSKGGEVRKTTKDRSSSENSGDSGSGGGRKPQQQEYSKQDYIHVRARRGQATDSHSLAERVRREKMSERMKFLQDLVPGCRKVTGKAVMLDEIINYVQSLQRQVESLSMKLASVSPAQQQQQSTTSTHWTVESLMSNKEIQFSSNNSNNLLAAASNIAPFGMMQQQQLQAPSPPVVVQQQQAGLLSPFGFGNVQHAIRNTSTAAVTTTAPPIAASLADLRSFDTNIPQFTGRDGELQCVVQHMGLHNRSFAGQFHCQLPVGHMKVEF